MRTRIAPIPAALHFTLPVTLLVTLFVTMTTGCYMPLPSHCTSKCDGAVRREAVNSFVPGVSSREDVLMTLGLPAMRKYDDRFFVYAWSRTTGMWCFGFGYSGDCSDVESTRYVVVEFDNDRVLRAQWLNPNRLVGGAPEAKLKALIDTIVQEES